MNSTPVAFTDSLQNHKSSSFLELSRLSALEISKAYKGTPLKDNYLDSTVNAIRRPLDGGPGILVNLTLRLSEGDHDEDLLLDELAKRLEETEGLPEPSSLSAEVDGVTDLDECAAEGLNDCDPSALCINEIGSYRCDCGGGFPDMEPSLPGRVCASEITSCDLCNGRGDCVRSGGRGTRPMCRCHRMYLGPHCEINGIRELI